MTDEQRMMCLRAINHWGPVHQKEKAVEELSELIVELMHDLDCRPCMRCLHEELADVIIMAEQLRIIYGAENVDGWIGRKLDRLEERINNGMKESAKLRKMLGFDDDGAVLFGYETEGGADDV